MKSDLIKARQLIIEAKRLLRPHFTKHHWPVFYEDIDYLITAINDCIRALAKGERLPV